MSRSGRGWGPFSGGQLTTMVCVIVAAVAFPVGAWAVSGSNVFVTDATSGAHAAVSSSGAVSVTGTVTANNANAKNLYENFAVTSSTLFVPVAQPAAGKALVITSLEFNTYAGAAQGNNLIYAVSAIDATCSFSAGVVGYVDPASNGVTSIPIPSGLVIPANRALCVADSEGLGVTATTFGYLVSASSAPSGADTPTKAATLELTGLHRP
jgi:hypothetical protein